MAAYVAWREAIVTSLITEVREAIHAVSPRTEVRLFATPGAQPPDGVRATELADGVLSGYASSDVEAQRRARELRDLAGDTPVHGMVRAIAPDTVDPAQIAPRVLAWREGGVAGINFYNYGLMTLPMLAAIGAALRRGESPSRSDG
ncbi:MAG: hypothetical protein M3336_06160 [Chloroflexota bacterium]|nr:hypothetical protein [Chloroflexota bacterium]